MTVYHLIAMVLFLKGVEGFRLQTMVGIDQSLISRSVSILDIISSGKGLMSTLVIITILLSIDMVFLIILGYDFPKLNISWNKIYMIESIIFIISLFVPVFRALLLFFSLNTIQIFIMYHIAVEFEKYNFPYLKYIIVMGGFLLVAKIVIFSIQHIGHTI